jgi:hypothetical protein
MQTVRMLILSLANELRLRLWVSTEDPMWNDADAGLRDTMWNSEYPPRPSLGARNRCLKSFKLKPHLAQRNSSARAVVSADMGTRMHVKILRRHQQGCVFNSTCDNSNLRFGNYARRQVPAPFTDLFF